MPETGRTHVGTYKGISWKIVVRGTTAFFYSTGFQFFLAMRLIILPCLKKEIAARGGFTCIGSAIRYQRTVFIFFGYPGCGKTTLLLKSLEHGAEFLGDNELVIDPEGRIQGVFDDIELRFSTARSTIAWRRLPAVSRLLLASYGILAFLTRNRVSFNVTTRPEELRIPKATPSSQTHCVFVHLAACQAKGPAASEDIIASVSEYERSYRDLFSDVFFSEQDFTATEAAMTSFLANCSCWRFPAGCDVKEILEIDKVEVP